MCDTSLEGVAVMANAAHLSAREPLDDGEERVARDAVVFHVGHRASALPASGRVRRRQLPLLELRPFKAPEEGVDA